MMFHRLLIILLKLVEKERGKESEGKCEGRGGGGERRGGERERGGGGGEGKGRARKGEQEKGESEKGGSAGKGGGENKRMEAVIGMICLYCYRNCTSIFLISGNCPLP